MKENSTEEYKNKLLETFVAFDKFCKVNGLKYYAAYGTLIGAVRHQGLIPWDDDIDVYMKRDDYNKFCSLKGKVDGHYDIMDINNDDYWLLALAKFVDTNTTLWEFKRLPLIIGVYIDVFPLDECNKGQVINLKNKYDKYSNLVVQSMEKYSLIDLYNSIIRVRIRTFLSQVSILFYKRLRCLYYKRKFAECIEENVKVKGDYLISYEGPYGAGEVFDKRLFAETVMLPFEGMYIEAPIGYEEYLTNIYGDYMQLPPEEKRVSHHGHYYLNLNHRLSLDEIKRELNI